MTGKRGAMTIFVTQRVQREPQRTQSKTDFLAPIAFLSNLCDTNKK
jgi:hypothetical protein